MGRAAGGDTGPPHRAAWLYSNQEGDAGPAAAGAARRNMAEPISAVDFRPEHQEELLALFQRNFGAWATERLGRRWEWQCGAGNPWRALRPTSGLVAFDEGRIVGGVVLFPVPWRVEGERLVFLCGGDFAIDRPYRMRVVPQLVRAFFGKLPVMANGLHPALWVMGTSIGAIGLPMSRVRYSLHLRNRGWMCRALRRRLPAAVGRLISPATAGRLLASQPVQAVVRSLARGGGPPRVRALPKQAPVADVRPLARFGEDYDRLWGEARRKFRMTLDKDAEYLNWRYLACPTFRHPILRGLYREGKLLAVAVAGAYTVLDHANRPCGANGEILELISAGASAPELEALLLSACRELDRKGVDKIGALSYDGTVKAALEQIGFQPEPDTRFDYAVLLDQAGRKPGRMESTEGVYITAGDGDMLNAFLI